MNKLFSIYRSSAGSGKTRTLAKEYLLLALRFRADYFKHILAVTFTNKATQEMKDRILTYLDDFANGKQNDLAEELKRELGLDQSTFQERCQEARASILHKYAQFSISTIDAFFQKVIRSFTREAGLTGDYRLEVEQDAVLEEVIDNLIDELGNNDELTHWVVEFAKENLENERAWDVRFNLIDFANEIFREEFKNVEEEVYKATADRSFFKAFRDKLWKQKNFFIARVSGPAAEAVKIIREQEWDVADISYGKNSGLISFFELNATQRTVKELKPPSDRIRTYFTDPLNWPNKKSRHFAAIKKIADEKLIPRLLEIIEAYDKFYVKTLTAEVVLRNMYVFGLISDIARKLKEYKDENNLMLLADAPKFLRGVIQDSDTPFIYEKVGSFYRNYLIDEFQDTSGLQWKNFLPLVTNSLDQGYPSLVVGDVKQAIYRWRGGDLNLLQEQVQDHIGAGRVEIKELASNYRSSANVVNFNNALFQNASAWAASETGHPVSVEAYKDVMQKTTRKENGFVHVEFMSDQSKEETWKQQSLDKIPQQLERLQEAGVALKDIAILVRTNAEGQEIVIHLLQYRNSEKAKPHCRYDVISNESLRLDGAASVNLLLGAMKYLLNPEDAIARAQLAYEYAKLGGFEKEFTAVFAVSNQVIFENQLPSRFTREKMSLKKLPLFELTETIIDIFELGKQSGELAYLQAFQDLVLDFYTRERNDLGAFLEWWEDNRNKKSIQVSGEVDAVQILTIHKSKGLQFNYVIVPFCSWNLDHETWKAPTLWVKSDEVPFTDAGYLPVKYSSTLEGTYFSEFFREERTRSYLDNLNILYVALTRAEDGLILFAPHPEVKNTKRTVAQVLFDSIQQNNELKNNWNESTRTWTTGVVNASVKKQNIIPTLTLQTYASSGWRDKLVIRQTAKGYFADDQEGVREKIRYGMQVHAVLSRIKLAADIGDTLDQIFFEGLISYDDRPALEAQLHELLQDEQVASWFSEGWEIRTEVPILLPGGNENRIDRLMIKDKHAVVVDFKTGEAVKSDQKQVLDYMTVLRQMNFTEVEGYLLYIKNREVVSVKSGKPKTIKKKNEGQLGLEF